MSRNWRRGLLRLWIVGSVVWVIGTASLWQFVVHPGWPGEMPPGPSTFLSDLYDRVRYTGNGQIPLGDLWPMYLSTWPEIRLWLVAVFLPPPVVLMIGLGLLWAVRGFRPRDTA